MGGSVAHKLSCQKGIAHDSRRPSALHTNDGGNAEEGPEQERGSALQEVFEALDEADDEPSQTGSDDTDYEDVPQTQAAADNGGNDGDNDSIEEALDADDEKDEEVDDEDAGAGADESDDSHRTLPNFEDAQHSNQYSRRAATISVPIRLDGFETTYATWEQFDAAIHQLQRDIFQLFSK
ncbi:hypothetical protein PC128_g20977 [Phytophthora cactorum]|nr:hypothetical protein PC120_g24894 [Phytophthora cactorum]KAG3047818.1 hypothetical protein PC121_g19851 [Phytophthora cactorum]KAG3160765.1 hypothetical protein PC128_g20977 [Phytophthora cactorum]